VPWHNCTAKGTAAAHSPRCVLLGFRLTLLAQERPVSSKRVALGFFSPGTSRNRPRNVHESRSMPKLIAAQFVSVFARPVNSAALTTLPRPMRSCPCPISAYRPALGLILRYTCRYGSSQGDPRQALGSRCRKDTYRWIICPIPPIRRSRFTDPSVLTRKLVLTNPNAGRVLVDHIIRSATLAGTAFDETLVPVTASTAGLPRAVVVHMMLSAGRSETEETHQRNNS